MGPATLLGQALARVLKRLKLPSAEAGFERPENPKYGDYATSVALPLAKKTRQSSMEIAEKIKNSLSGDSAIGRLAERVEIAPPGFVNVFLSQSWLQKQVGSIIAAGRDYGKLQTTRYKLKTQVEFISANPTGPLTLANGRGGFLGDTLANVLEAAGHKVTREYYVNDAGEQVKKLGWSVLAAKGFETPYQAEELYQGSYIRELAEKVMPVETRNPKSETLNKSKIQIPKLTEYAAREGSKLLLKDIKRVVRKAGIRFDVWFSEKSLYRQGFVDEMRKMLKNKKLIEEKEGAVWLKTRELGESKNKVLVKSSGDATYLLPDLAYHREKFVRRKFDTVIDIVGADHHGHMQALRAGLRALGLKQPEVVLVQFVRLVEHGKEVKMSKRAGTFVTLEELLNAVGKDVARFFFLQSAPSRHMDFDLDLAREQSQKNPVYYVQYAHARINSILMRAAEQRRINTQNHAELLVRASEIALMKHIVRLPDFIARIAQNYEVHHLTTYNMELATAFHAFYRDCRVISENAELTQARLSLCRTTQVTLANTLRLMGIRAPERM